jgi:hypothetical protein
VSRDCAIFTSCIAGAFLSAGIVDAIHVRYLISFLSISAGISVLLYVYASYVGESRGDE